MNGKPNFKDASATLFSGIATLAIVLGVYRFVIVNKIAAATFGQVVATLFCAVVIYAVAAVCLAIILKALVDLLNIPLKGKLDRFERFIWPGGFAFIAVFLWALLIVMPLTMTS